MSETYVYKKSGENMEIGDEITIRRAWFLPNLSGRVVHVYDPQKPYVVKGDNEYGFTVELKNKVYRWYGGPPDDTIVLRQRHSNKNEGPDRNRQSASKLG